MKIKNVHIRNAHIVARPLEPVSGYLFNATSITNWAGVNASGSPALRDGKYLEFTGTQSLTTDNINTSTLSTDDYTYEFWLRTTGTNTGALLTKFGYGGYQISAVEVATNTLVPGFYVGSQAYLPVDTHITRDVWQHYTVVYTSGNGHLKTYYNGELVADAILGTEVSPRFAGYNPMYFTLFGASGYGFGYSGALIGDLGEFRLYTRALGINEVQQNYVATRSRWLPAEPTGLTSADPSTSAYAIKQAYPDSTDGLYWIQNANINSGNPVQIYADMTTDGGGWTLILQNVYGDWTYNNCLLRDQTSAPSALGSSNYSIIGWADEIKRSASGFEYMLDAGTRNSNGGIFTANEAYSFTGQADLTALSAVGPSLYFGGTQYNTDGYNAVVSTGNGFRQNITRTTTFGTWEYNNNGLEKRMPWFTTNSPGISGQAILTTTNADSGSWWGTLMTDNGAWQPAPWQADASVANPGVIWYWVR